MATLLLTTVGGAIGGPIGAALGATLGQGIDRSLFAPKARQGPRLTELAVQTSSYGTQIPRVFGRMRVAGCVIWSTDLTESRHNGRAGKGQPTVTGYSYAASFAVALSARRIVAVERIWADGKLLRGAAGDWKTATDFRLYPGDEDQLPDPLIASLTPHAPAHRGIAYALFENLQLADFGNRIPSLTFEVVADADPPTIGAIARDVAQGALTGAGPAQVVEGFCASGSSMAGAIEVLAQAGGAWMVPDGGAMRMVSQLAATKRRIEAGAQVRDIRRPIESVARTMAVSHYDPARDYQIGVQQAARTGGAGWRDEAIPLPVAIAAPEARRIAQATLFDAERKRVSRRVMLTPDALSIGPGDAVSFVADGSTWRVSQAHVEGWRVTLDLASAEIMVTAATAADPGRVLPAPDVTIGATLIEAAELPSLDDTIFAASRVAVFATGSGAGWRAAAVLRSRDDGATWEEAGATAAPAIMGRLSTSLPMGSGSLIDHDRAIEVVLAHDAMMLETLTAELLDRGRNLALVGDELLQFRDVVQVAPRRWRLSTLLRARRGTTGKAHRAGTRFVLVERETMLLLDAPGWRSGETLRFMASGVGDAAPAAASATSNGLSIAPPAPVHLRWSSAADGAAIVRWIRRSRLGWRWDDAAETPLGEERERYRVVVVSGLGTRASVVDVPELLVSAAERERGPVTVSVQQQGTLAISPETSLTF